jgi:hypothetical protein
MNAGRISLEKYNSLRDSKGCLRRVYLEKLN